MIRKEINILKEDLCHCNINISKDKHNKIDKVPNERIIIKPKSKQNSIETVQHVKSNINVGELGIGINKVSSGANGKIIVDLEKEKDKTILTKEINDKLGNMVDVTIVSKKRPKIKIIGITKEIFSMDQSILTGNIWKQNNLLNFDEKIDIKLIKKYMKNDKTGSMIIEINPMIHKLLLDSGRIKIGWMSFKLYNFIDVNRCFNCWGYNHKAVNCRRAVVCRKCGEQHKESECENSVKKCINCLNWVKKYNLADWNINHEATDIECNFYAKMLKNEANRILHVIRDN